MSVLRSSGISMKLIFQLNVNLFKELRICSHTTGTTGYAKSNQKPSPLFKSNADTELRIYKLLNTHSLERVWWGKSKPVKARLVDAKLMKCGRNMTKELSPSQIFSSWRAIFLSRTEIHLAQHLTLRRDQRDQMAMLDEAGLQLDKQGFLDKCSQQKSNLPMLMVG